jgi:hypothetical protein
VRVARGASISLAGGHARRALTEKGGAVPVSRSRASRNGTGRVESFDSRTRESASCKRVTEFRILNRRIFVDRDSEIPKHQKLQSPTELRNFVKLKCLPFLFIFVIKVVDCS